MHPQEKDLSKPRILVAPLDWGLGHATRCIPVIYELISQGADVWLAGEGAQEKLLHQEFPNLTFLSLEGYRVRYGRGSTSLIRQLLFQLPGILRNIKEEHQWLKNAVNEFKIDGVISDNRFGFYHKSVPSVFITHQLQIKSPWQWTEKLLQKRNYRYIERFSECWVPDEEEVNNFAGELSHPQQLPAVSVKYVGLLSRLKAISQPEQSKHLFISLSGPEPQRTILENKIVNQISHYNGTATIVRGLPNGQTIIPSTNDIQFHNHLPADEYNQEIQKAEFVISRSGYSTVMDLANVGKKSILIPTPGQTEQEYLAAFLDRKKFALSAKQKDFNLYQVLEQAQSFNYEITPRTNSSLSEVIESFLKKC